MAITQLSDIGVFPNNTSDYILQESIETNEFWHSGIFRRNTNATVQAVLNDDGFEVVIPFFNDLTGSSQIMQEGTNLTIGKVTTGSDKVPVMERAKLETRGITNKAIYFPIFRLVNLNRFLPVTGTPELHSSIR